MFKRVTPIPSHSLAAALSAQGAHLYFFFFGGILCRHPVDHRWNSGSEWWMQLSFRVIVCDRKLLPSLSRHCKVSVATFFITSSQSVSGDCIVACCVNVSAFTASFKHRPHLCCVGSKLQDLLVENIQDVPEYFVSLSFVDAVLSCWPHLQM